MKNMLKTGVVGAVAAVIVASVAFAAGQDQGPRRGPGFGGPGGPGGRGMMAPIMRELTDEQRSQVRAILQEERGNQQGPPPVVTLRRELATELMADSPNDQRIETLKGQILAAETEGLSRQVEIQKRIAQVLTPEQRAKVREQLAKAPEGRRGRGNGGRGF